MVVSQHNLTRSVLEGAATQALEMSTLKDLIVRIRLSKGAWACDQCPKQTFKSRDAAYKHVQRTHKGSKACTKAKVRTQEAAERHLKRLSVKSSRRYRAKQRLPTAFGSPVAESGPLEDLIANISVVSCTGVVLHGEAVQRCKNRAINCQGIGTDRRSDLLKSALCCVAYAAEGVIPSIKNSICIYQMALNNCCLCIFCAASVLVPASSNNTLEMFPVSLDLKFLFQLQESQL